MLNRASKPFRTLSCVCLVLAACGGAIGCSSGSTTTVDVTCGDGGQGETGTGSGSGDATAPDGGAPDAGASDSGAPQADGGSTSTPDGGADSGGSTTSGPETYNDFADPQNWQSYSPGGSYLMAAFDGRYLYAIPSGSGVVARYDTRASFVTASSWTSFDVGTIDSSAGGYRGAAFDGRYLYLVPYTSAPSVLGGVAVQYDTHGDFGTASSWSTFDITTVNAGATGYFGAAFDGRYVYYIPYGQDTAQDGIVARYDTWAPFASSSSWVTFDTATLGPEVQGFLGGVFDGRYMYLSPYGYSYGNYGSMVTRYDTQGSFTDASGWATFDTTQVNTQAVGYFGAGFDGRYAYFEPYNGNGSWGHQVTRYDTLGDFSSGSSWATFDTTALNIAPAGTVFDGRFLYLVPNVTSAGASGLVARLDTTTEFTSPASWSEFDTTSLTPSVAGFFGGAFDGQYVYLIGATIARFDAKSPPSMPSAYHGSFY